MPKYETSNGRPVFVNFAHVVMAEPTENIGETSLLLPMSAVSISAQGAGGGLVRIIIKETFTNVSLDMERWEKATRRGGLSVVA